MAPMKWVRFAASWTGAALLCTSFVPFALAGSPTSDADLAGVRAEFRAAWARVRDNEPDIPDSPVLQTYPIFPYLQAVRLQRALRLNDPHSDASISGFLELHRNEPVTQGLLKSWLASLAQREEWTQFLPHYAADVSDINLRCSAATGRLRSGDTKDLLGPALELWMTPTVLPPSCAPVIQWLTDHLQLTPDRIERRARAALAAGQPALAETLARDLPAAQGAPILEWAALLQDPQSEVEHVIQDPQVPVEWAALLEGFTRLARHDPDQAAADYTPLSQARTLSKPQLDLLARAVALGFAWARESQALQWFDRIALAPDDELGQDWRIRAALWARDWRRARAALTALPAARQSEVRYRYWNARLLQIEGNTAAARNAYQSLLSETGFYGAAAAWRLGQPYTPQPTGTSSNPALLAELGGRPAAVRARELVAVGLSSLAGAEWAQIFSGADDRAKGQAPMLAFQWGWYEQAIASAAKLGIRSDYTLLYPRPYDAAVDRASGRTGVPREWLYAVLRQESLYRADAVSGAGAVGLMQLLPDTAKRVAVRLGVPSPSRDALFDPATNTLLGASDLRDLLSQFEGSLPLALAAYNAGENAAARWRPPAPVDADIWIDNIPYNETRGYVQRIIWHIVIFGWESQGRGPRLDAILRQVAPEVPAGPTP